MCRLSTFLAALITCLFASAEQPRVHEERSVIQHTPGPLRPHPVNPRYFTDGSKLADGSWRVVYLTGSHTWANLIDRGPTDPPPKFEFGSYLEFLQKHNHNFIRLWGRQLSWYPKYGDVVLYAGPLPWQRTGPSRALDGKPKFDLTKFDTVYFERLRSRIIAAGEHGIYVFIMLFGGYQESGPNWTGSPFHRDNNISGVDGDPDRDGRGLEIESLSAIPDAVAEVQKAYVRQVVDCVNDLDNVLFEISNEGGETSKDWQYEMIRFLQKYERTKPKQHPVGMTAGYWSADENRTTLDASPADWVSYLFEIKPAKGQEALNVHDPFVASGRKVSIQDSDHWWVVSIYGDSEFGRQWVWKSFCRSHNPILMEHLPPRSFIAQDHPLSLEDRGYVASRMAMCHTISFAERMPLASMQPSNDIASSTFCLAAPGEEYLVYSPVGGTVAVDLSGYDREFSVEWFDPAAGKAMAAGRVRGGDRREFHVPFAGDAVLYLALIERD